MDFRCVHAYGLNERFIPCVVNAQFVFAEWNCCELECSRGVRLRYALNWHEKKLDFSYWLQAVLNVSINGSCTLSQGIKQGEERKYETQDFHKSNLIPS